MSGLDYQLPPLEWIRAFEASARLGSFTAAAQETDLTQPAVSQRIANLESHLGARLFRRQARTIALTVEGEAWLPHVQAALSGLTASSEVLFGKKRNQLTISASQSVIALWLMPRLARIAEVTEATISVQSFVLGVQSSTVDDVIQIRYGSGGWPHFYQQPLYQDIMVPVAAPHLKSAEWTSLPRIACSGPRPDWGDFADACGLPRLPLPHLRFDTFVNALNAARNGLGVALGSLPLCAADLEAGRLVRLSSDQLAHDSTYWLLGSKSAISARQWDRLVELV